MRRIRRFLSRPMGHKWLLLKAWFLVGAVRCALWVLPYKAVTGVLDRLKARRPARLAGAPTEPVAWAVRSAGRLFPRGRHCLTQSLVAETLLLRRGHAARIHIGVTREQDQGVLGHAWVDVDGSVLVGGEDNLARYTELQTPGRIPGEILAS